MVGGRGLAGVLRDRYPRWVLLPVVFALLLANVVAAGADVGAIAAGVALVVPVAAWWLVVPVALLILGVQTWCSYALLHRVFKWLTLALFGYVVAALLARPDWSEVLRGTFMPGLAWDRDLLLLLVAIVGTTLSPYLYFWQAGQRVEEEKAQGRRTLRQRQGATREELSEAALDVDVGMLFGALVMYAVILSAASTLHEAGRTEVASAEEAAGALRPLAGEAAGLLFALGIVGVGMLAVPVLTTGAAYALAETFGWRHGLDERPHRAPAFYAAIALSTLAAAALNFTGVNPIDALVYSGVVMGLLAPPLLVLMMLVSSDPRVMGARVNGPGLKLLGWITTLAATAAAVALVAAWIWA